MSEAPNTLVRYVSPAALDQLTPQLTVGEISVLDTINTKVAAAESLDKVMSFLFKSTRDICPCDRISVAFLEDHSKRVTSRWVAADYSPVHLKVQYSEGLAGSSLQEVINTGHPRIIDDLEKYLEHNPDSNSTRLLVREGVRSSMTCPLFVEGRIVGLLFRSSRRYNAYDDQQVMLHSQLAERLSQAVEKAYRIEQLETTNRAYMELLGFASHELKSPLGSIIMEADLLARGYLGELQPKQAEKVQSIIGKAKLLLDTTREYLDLARIEGGQLKAEIKSGVDLRKQLLDPALEALKPQSEAKQNQIIIECVPQSVHIDCDPGLLKIVFTNLIGNAVKYSAQSGQIKIDIKRTDDRLRVSVWNAGPGFPKEQTSKLFKRFSRLSVPEFKKIKGTGVGLYTTWQIIQLHHGRIWARSEYGSWAEFTFEMPQ